MLHPVQTASGNLTSLLSPFHVGEHTPPKLICIACETAIVVESYPINESVALVQLCTSTIVHGHWRSGLSDIRECGFGEDE